MENPLVSVLIPSYNHSTYISQTVDSIATQDYENIELIIIDDGSTDNSWEVIQQLNHKYSNRFSRFIIEQQQNSKIPKTLNNLIAKALGEYIVMIASDDVLTKDAVSVMQKFLSNNKAYDLVVGINSIIDKNGDDCYWDKDQNIVYDQKLAKYTTFSGMLQESRPDVNFYSDQFGSYKSLTKGNYIANGYMVRKIIFDKIGKYPQFLLEDWWFALQFSKIAKMKFIDHHTCKYRWHSTNTVKNREFMIKISQDTIDSEKLLSIKIRRILMLIGKKISKIFR